MAALFLATCISPAAAWEPAVVEPRVDNLDRLLAGCHAERAEIAARHRVIDTWVAHRAAEGEDVRTRYPKPALPDCSGADILARLGSHPGVWAMTTAEAGDAMFATVNLPLAGLLMSTDGGDHWHYRHLFLRGHNVERSILLRGLDSRHGLLAVASDDGVLLSEDGGYSFTRALPGRPFWAVAISPHDPRTMVAGGDGTSYLSADGGATWSDLGFTGFARRLETRNRHLTDHVTSIEFDPERPEVVYVGTGSHLYRWVRGAPGEGRWQAMEGTREAWGRVHDDSTVYNIAIGSRFMISTCNGVYYLSSLGADVARDQAEVTWGKFRDRAFSGRDVGGPKGNLRSYFVSEDPQDPGRILVADFAGLYEGRSGDRGMSWRRVEGLPFYSRETGYPEYTAIAWSREGEPVVGSRYRGIFVEERSARRPAHPAGPACTLR